MSLPREPRQKMINMMYLVLTALLALNVSAEILNAFKTVNNSLEKTNTQISTSTTNVMTSLQTKLNEPGTRDKALIWYPKAQQAQAYAATAYGFIQTMKDSILRLAGGDPNDPTKKYKDDNLDIPTRLMIDKGNGKKLLQTLTDFKTKILALDPAIMTNFQATLPIDLNPPKSNQKSEKSWEYAYFHMVPTVAALTILSKFQNDIKTSENKVITFCHEQVGKVEVQQDTYAAIAVADATYVLPGQDINVTAGVGGFSTKVSPRISINGSGVNVDAADGTAKQKITASGIGDHTIPVHIEFTDQNGKVQQKDIQIKYTVGQSTAAVQLDKMNVLFIGVDNPITVSGSGSMEKMEVYASGPGGANVTGTGSSRHVTVTTETDDCVINVKTSDGKVTPVKFRVRSIPDPIAMVGRNKGGNMPAVQFKAQGGVSAVLENFYYQTQFIVTSFRIIGDGEGFADPMEVVNNGNTWSQQAQTLVNKVRPGSYVYIEDIKCVGPDKRTRSLPPIYYNLK